jgi:hypothetical protein
MERLSEKYLIGIASKITGASNFIQNLDNHKEDL